MAETEGLLLGLDAGNTVIKAVLFDERGNQLASAKRDGRSSTPAPGHVERDLGELWSNAATVIRECLDGILLQGLRDLPPHWPSGLGHLGHEWRGLRQTAGLQLRR